PTTASPCALSPTPPSRVLLMWSSGQLMPRPKRLHAEASALRFPQCYTWWLLHSPRAPGSDLLSAVRFFRWQIGRTLINASIEFRAAVPARDPPHPALGQASH